MGQLFDKPMDELREAFVLARFAEPAFFGHPDIEDWLRHEWESRHPNRSMEGFGRFDGLIARHAPHPLTAEHLPKYATPVRRSGNWQRWADDAGPNHKKIIVALVKGGARLYRSYDGGPVFVVDGSWFVANSRAIKGFDEPAFLDVVFSEWEYSGRKAGAAREFICGAMFKAIQAVRQAAERDFDEACAVSTDGTKIVKAEEVLVIADNRRSMIIFPASAFTEDKILRVGGNHRVSSQGTSRFNSIDDYVAWFLKTDDPKRQLKQSDGQLLETGPWFDKKRRLITEARHCPSPLPDGGREIRV